MPHEIFIGSPSCVDDSTLQVTRLHDTAFDNGPHSTKGGDDTQHSGVGLPTYNVPINDIDVYTPARAFMRLDVAASGVLIGHQGALGAASSEDVAVVADQLVVPCSVEDESRVVCSRVRTDFLRFTPSLWDCDREFLRAQCVEDSSFIARLLLEGGYEGY